MIASPKGSWGHLPAEAVQFLEAIGRPDLDAVRVRGIHWDPDRAQDKSRKADLVSPALDDWQSKGFSIYVVVNQGGDTDDSITEAVAVFIEWDDRPLTEQLAFDWDSFGFPAPPVQVYSGGKSLHCYWPLSEPCTDLIRWRELQTRLIKVFQSDKTIKNPSRVMRLPGYRHFSKKDGSPGDIARLERCDRQTFSLEELEAALTAVEQRMGINQPKAAPQLPRPVSRTNVVEFPHQRLQLEHLLSKEHKQQLARGVREGSRNATAFAIAVDAIACADELSRLGIPYDGRPEQLLEEFNCRCSPSLSDGEVDAIWQSAQKQPRQVHQGFEKQLSYLLGRQQRQQGSQRGTPSQTDEDDDIWLGGKPGCLEADDSIQGGTELVAVHQTLRQMVEDGDSDPEIQEFINAQGGSGHGLRQFVDAVRKQLQEGEEARESVARLLYQDDTFEPTVAAYLPDEFQGLTRILRQGLGYPEPAIVMTILVAVTAMLRPDIRVRALSFEQPCILWLFLVAGSGVGKTPLLKHLVLDPLQKGVLINLHESNQQRLQEWQQQTASAQQEKKEPPSKPRRRNCVITSTTTQGIRADMAANGADTPMFLVKDELSSWLKEMTATKDNTSDVGFFLSAYDGSYNNDVLADESRCREVKQGKLSVIGGIQPEVFEEYLPRGVDNGFNTRPLFVHLPRVPKDILDGDLNRLVCTLAQLYEAAFEGQGLAPGAVYTPTPLAKAAFIEFFRQTDARGMEATSSAVDAIWQKANGQVLRVAAGLQFLRDFYGMDDPEPPSGNPLRPRISFDTMALAIQLVVAGKVTGVAIHERATSPQAARAARFMEKARALLTADQWVALGEFSKKCWDSRKRPAKPELLALAQELQLAGQIRLSPDGKKFSLGPGSIHD